MKPVLLEIVPIRVVRVNDFNITLLEIDVLHINFGLDGTKKLNKGQRSYFLVEDIVALFRLLDGVYIEPHYSSDHFDYYVAVVSQMQKSFKIVFCIEKEQPTTAGIISLYRIKKRGP